MKSSVKYIIRRRALGDVLWVEPVIQSLARENKKVIVISEYNEVFENYPLQNVSFKNKLSRFEKLLYKIELLFNIQNRFIKLDLAYEKDCTTHFLLAYYKKAKCKGMLQYPQLYLTKEEKNSKPETSKYIVLNIEKYTSVVNYRNANGIDWEQTCNYLKEKGFKVIQVGRIDNKIKDVEFRTTSVRELIILLKNASFFIGQDSGPSHIAQCLSIPSLVFFGSINPWFRHVKHLFKGFILQQNCEYAGCYHLQTMGEQTCLISGQEDIPKCTLHSTQYVQAYINRIIEEYKL